MFVEMELQQKSREVLGLNVDAKEIDIFEVVEAFQNKFKFVSHSDEIGKRLILAKNCLVSEYIYRQGKRHRPVTLTGCKACYGLGGIPSYHKIYHFVDCEQCKGTGIQTTICKFCEGKKCPRCNNTGFYVWKKNWKRDKDVSCRVCEGTGQCITRIETTSRLERFDNCEVCHGIGIDSLKGAIRWNINDDELKLLLGTKAP